MFGAAAFAKSSPGFPVESPKNPDCLCDFDPDKLEVRSLNMVVEWCGKVDSFWVFSHSCDELVWLEGGLDCRLLGNVF